MKVDVVGAIITAICCFTPALVVIFGVVGLGIMVDYLDLILLPLLGLFVLSVIIAYVKQRNAV